MKQREKCNEAPMYQNRTQYDIYTFDLNRKQKPPQLETSSATVF